MIEYRLKPRDGIQVTAQQQLQQQQQQQQQLPQPQSSSTPTAAKSNNKSNRGSRPGPAASTFGRNYFLVPML
jgi:hypothetical protein